MTDTKQQALAQGLIEVGTAPNRCAYSLDGEMLFRESERGWTYDKHNDTMPVNYDKLLALRAEALAAIEINRLSNRYEGYGQQADIEAAQQEINDLQAKLLAAEERAEKAEGQFNELYGKEKEWRKVYAHGCDLLAARDAKLAKVKEYIGDSELGILRDILAILHAKPAGPCCGDEYGDKVTLPGEEG